MSAPSPDDMNWVVVIPAKTLATAKSRLADVAGTRRPELALAMLVDTVTAAAGTPGVRSVLVVTDDERIAAAVAAVGAVVTPDEPRAGLNAAFEHGITQALSTNPGCGVALLTGDLPALRAAELGGVLHRAWTSSAGVIAVADRDGDGTTLLAARTPTQLHPAYGPGSFARHLTLGAMVADLDGLTGLRCDVDDAAGLRAAVEIGVGAATAALLAAAHAQGPGSLTDPGP
ncbi:MAG TPA: 2-phospho-L-lactate guanylyltransferase [Acidothermaceae bacterium]|jgi:2-phospho-L-lactate guanylyltransferase|nr:2-phospho-L-lactate guanylyltransferase [Acidothermaceae bacterium]